MTTTFEPACMTPDELAGWHAANDNIYSRNDRAVRPCQDCPLAFAAEMRGAGCCNGEPHRSGRYAVDPRPAPRFRRYPDAATRLHARREQWRLSSQRRRAAARVA